MTSVVVSCCASLQLCSLQFPFLTFDATIRNAIIHKHHSCEELRIVVTNMSMILMVSCRQSAVVFPLYLTITKSQFTRSQMHCRWVNRDTVVYVVDTNVSFLSLNGYVINNNCGLLGPQWK